MTMPPATTNALGGEDKEPEIGHGIDDLGRVLRRIIVLESSSARAFAWTSQRKLLHTS